MMSNTASLSYESNKLDIIYRFLIVGFLYQKQVTQMLEIRLLPPV